jgi:t-SNARE complex subunit (syntaxin)
MAEIDALEDGILSSESIPLMVERRVTKSNQVRQAGIQRIEKDMFTVNQLFKDLSGMVVQQNEMIKSVDASVSSAVENTSRAKEEIQKTHNRYKERQAFVIRVVTFLFAFLLIVFITRRMLFSHW